MERIGELRSTRRLAAEFKSPTVHQEKLLQAAVEIRQTTPTDFAFLARQLVQCTLPHANPGNVEAWQRQNGYLSLVIRPGWDSKKNKVYGYPYGSVPRLLLFWINSEAVRTQSRRLTLGSNLSEFMRAVGLNPRNGSYERGDRQRLQNQMERLFRASISFVQSTPDADRWLNMDVTSAGELWWNPSKAVQDSLWESWIELGEKFYEAIVASPVPIDIRALRALKRSPLALDLYAWSAYTSHKVNHHRRGEPLFIPWDGLLRQLGCDYDPKRIDNFKGKVKAAMRKVSTVFPQGLKYTWSTAGITFTPGTVPPVAIRSAG